MLVLVCVCICKSCIQSHRAHLKTMSRQTLEDCRCVIRHVSNSQNLTWQISHQQTNAECLCFMSNRTKIFHCLFYSGKDPLFPPTVTAYNLAYATLLNIDTKQHQASSFCGTPPLMKLTLHPQFVFRVLCGLIKGLYFIKNRQCNNELR